MKRTSDVSKLSIRNIPLCLFGEKFSNNPNFPKIQDLDTHDLNTHDLTPKTQISNNRQSQIGNRQYL
jgi:hypothetical protein